MAESKPGDLVGQDSSGKVRIDRVIPLPWALGMLSAVIVQAVTLWFQVQAASDTIKEVRQELKVLSAWQNQALVKDAEVVGELRELRRRVENLEARRP